MPVETSFEFRFALGRLHRLPAWLWELRWLWILLAWPALFLLAADWLGCLVEAMRPERLRYAGGALQLLGVGALALKIRRAEIAAGRRTVREFLSGWLARFPLLKRRYKVEVHDAVHAHATVVGGDLETWPALNKDAELAERVGVLESKVETLRDRANRHRERMRDEMGQLSQAMARDRAAHSESSKKLKDGFYATLFADVHLEWMSVLWILCGIALSTFSDGFVVAFGWLYRALEIPLC
jgi:hypothetical protein